MGRSTTRETGTDDHGRGGPTDRCHRQLRRRRPIPFDQDTRTSGRFGRPCSIAGQAFWTQSSRLLSRHRRFVNSPIRRTRRESILRHSTGRQRDVGHRFQVARGRDHCAGDGAFLAASCRRRTGCRRRRPSGRRAIGKRHHGGHVLAQPAIYHGQGGHEERHRSFRRANADHGHLRIAMPILDPQRDHRERPAAHGRDQPGDAPSLLQHDK